MNINFDNLRRNIGNSVNSLITLLNAKIITDEHDDSECIVVYPEEIRKDLNDIRSSVGTLLSIYDPDDSDINVIDMDLKIFQPDEP